MFNLFNRKSHIKDPQTQHEHNWKLVALNDKYNTVFTDSNKTEHWQIRFYECACGKRKCTDNHFGTDHPGINKAKANWIDAGVVPKNSYFPDTSNGYVAPPAAEREELDPVLAYQKTLEDLVNSLGVVINRDFDLEAKYPDLKEAADNYHLILEQYRVIEILKEKA